MNEEQFKNSEDFVKEFITGLGLEITTRNMQVLFLRGMMNGMIFALNNHHVPQVVQQHIGVLKSYTEMRDAKVKDNLPKDL